MQAISARLALTLAVVLLSFAVAAPAAFALEAAPAPAAVHAAAQEGQPADPAETGRSVVTPVVWTISGIVAAALLLMSLYMLKRRVGGFPENPTWVAPITIMTSGTFPDEGSYHDPITERGAGGGHDLAEHHH